MNKIETVEFANFAGVGVPVGSNGRYLDWSDERLGQPLAGPYGPHHFVVGDAGTHLVCDFIRMPDGRVVLQFDQTAPLLHPEDVYQIHEAAEAAEAAYRMTERMLECLARVGVEHDPAEWDADAWYWMRAVAKEVGAGRHAGMADAELRGL